MKWSALVIEVHEAPPAFEAFRLKYDPVAALGVPAHITVLSPFMNPDELNESAISRLRSLFSALPGVAFDLFDTGTFTGDKEDVLYLAPDPDEALCELTEAVIREFPMFPPYGGAHYSIVPHLTLGRVPPAPTLDALRSEFLQSAEFQHPLRCEVNEVTLLVGDSESCSRKCRFLLRV